MGIISRRPVPIHRNQIDFPALRAVMIRQAG
jgi:hypothetical protein